MGGGGRERGLVRILGMFCLGKSDAMTLNHASSNFRDENICSALSANQAFLLLWER